MKGYMKIKRMEKLRLLESENIEQTPLMDQ